jgi:hypothetical protein
VQEAKNKYVQVNSVENIEPVETEEIDPQILDLAEVKALLKAAKVLANRRSLEIVYETNFTQPQARAPGFQFLAAATPVSGVAGAGMPMGAAYATEPNVCRHLRDASPPPARCLGIPGRQAAAQDVFRPALSR